jgi:translocation and assembly module TamB
MSDFDSTPSPQSESEEQVALETRPPEPPNATGPESPRRRSRLRRFFLRHLPLTVGGAAVLLSLALVGLYFWASSAAFENAVRERLVAGLEELTGGRVEIASFHWRLLGLEAEANGVVLHGLEAPGEAPYARIEHLRVRWSVLGIWSPRVLLRDLQVSRPQLHLIVYPDGSTNQPQPRKPAKPGKPRLQTLFDLQAGRIAIEQGMVDYEDRASDFDFQDRYIPLDLAANDVSLRMAYMPPAAGNPESYHIDAGAGSLSLGRSAESRKAAESVHGRVEATLDLVRSAAYLRSLRLMANGHTLELSGLLQDFARPRWQAKATGDLDMRLLEPITGYPYAPVGIAHLDLSGAGNARTFRGDGTIHVEGGSYIGTGVIATGVRLDARVHADPEQLLITSIVARLRPGGQIEGEVALSPWLPPIPGAAVLQPAGRAAVRATGPKPNNSVPIVHPPPSVIPVIGKVTARFKNVALDTILDMVSERPFTRLGLDALVNGPAIANWNHGDARTLSVNASLALSPSGHGLPGEVPSSGAVFGTYTQRNGAVALSRLELRTPASLLEVHGQLGAYPLASPSAFAVEFHSQNLGEFDTVLRDLGVARNGKAGVAALPVAIAGQIDFLRGSWNGSLSNPRIAGDLRATQLAVELPAAAGSKPGEPQSVHLDAVEATVSYSAARIDVSHGVVRRGKSAIDLTGTLDAMPAGASAPSFDSNAVLHLRARANEIGMDDVRPFLAHDLPVAGTLNAQIQADGVLRTLGGAGWVELDKGSVYGEPVARIRAEGNIAGQTIKLNSLTVSEEAGKVSATGSYDLKSRRFQLDAKGAAINVARIQWLHHKGVDVTGKLGFSVQGSGTLDDPRLEAHATLAGLQVSGEPLGGLELVAHTANRSATYDLSTRLEGAELTAHGQTALNGDYPTQAKIQFSRFNIAALFKMAHMQGLSGESALAGTVTLEGPLAKVENLRGEARLQQLAVTVAGVHLKSEGGVHATIANGRINLDPLHVTGEETDLHAQGSLALKDKQELDFAASGSINLKVAETLDPDLTASGTTTFQVEAHGPLTNPGLRGRIDFQNGALSLEDLPNGLSQLHGTLEFSQNRLEVKSLTAMSGGGLLSVSGYLAYQHGIFADLAVKGNGIRIRYPSGVSSLADASLHLQGSQNNLLLGGDVVITRFTVSPDLDIAALATQTNNVQPVASPDAPSNHIRMDVHITSSPQLNFQNAYAKLAGNVDLRLRGTVASPSLLGRVSIIEGNAMIAGPRYVLQRGDVFFTNPVRIQPSIDLNATAHVEDYDITLGLHGTPDKLAVTYRSDPPLPEADVVALLALGRTQSQQRLYTQQQEAAGANPTTDALLGGALNATVSSRVQRLFGAGSVKVDPNYLGALGNSTSRIIVEEQLGSNVTLTYATNVNTTAQQLIQAEVAINRHVSVLVARDESGVFSMVLKATRRYR